MLAFTSCMAPNMESLCGAIADLAGVRLGVRTRLVDEIPWPERERRFRCGRIDVVWICGLPWVWMEDEVPGAVELLAAPVMRGARYAGEAVYFSEVLVRSESDYQRFDDLRGARFGYNEPRSHSGYNVVRQHLAVRGERAGFFGAALQTGAHQTSLAWLLDGRIDAAAVDTTVLEVELDRDASLRRRLRAVEVLGPSPMPPWLVRTGVDRGLRAALRELLLNLHLDAEGRAILDAFRVERFSEVDAAHYGPIRRMAAAAEGVRL